MNKINEEYIRLYRKRAEARLLKEYNEHQYKLIEETFERDKNYELLKKLSYFLEYYNNNDSEMVESKIVVFEELYKNVKNIKKEQIELETARKKLLNKGLIKEEPVVIPDEKEDTTYSNDFHKTVDELYTKCLRLKEQYYKNN